MVKFDFRSIRYRRPLRRVGARFIEDIVGLDSEAYGDGKPCMFCLHDGTCVKPEDLLPLLFSRQYRNAQIVVWNLRYESGAILRTLKRDQLTTLRECQEVTVGEYKYKYFPHKFLRITKGKNSVTFWDLAGFYQMALGKASKKYIGKRKLDFNVKRMTRAFVSKNWEKLKRYCVNDAYLTRELGLYLLRYLGEFGIKPSALYSQASISFLYFKKEGGVVDVWRYWRERKRLLYFACQAYAGGKFEMTRRGKFKGEIWDISSAYPYEMSKFKDITGAKVIYSPVNHPKADFGFLKVTLDIPPGVHHSVPVKFAGVNTYPAGLFTTYITKPEYDYLLKRKVKIEVHEAYWLFCVTNRRPMARVFAKLYKMKEAAGEADIMKYDCSKKIANGFYGKTCQLTPLPDGTLRAGPGWNPIYAATCTALVRLRMSEAQELLGSHCYAVHTDSVLTEKSIPKSWQGEKLGDWKLKKSGDGVILACGVYQHAGKSANRGYEMKKSFRWTAALRKAKSGTKIKMNEHRPMSWVLAANTGHIDRINEFMDFPKEFDLNSDVKRIWPKKMNARQLLQSSQQSLTRVVFNPKVEKWITSPDSLEP